MWGVWWGRLTCWWVGKGVLFCLWGWILVGGLVGWGAVVLMTCFAPNDFSCLVILTHLWRLVDRHTFCNSRGNTDLLSGVLAFCYFSVGGGWSFFLQWLMLYPISPTPAAAFSIAHQVTTLLPTTPFWLAYLYLLCNRRVGCR